MRHKRKSPLSADFSFGEYSTSLNTCEDSADSPYVIQRAVMQAMDEEFYHKSHYYLPRRCRVRLYDRQGKVIHQSESVVLGARLPRIYMSASYRKTYCASFKVWELEVDRSALVPVGLRHRAVRAEVIACPDVPDYCSAYERVIWSAGLTPGPAPLLLPRRDRSGKTKKSKRVKVDTGSCLRRWRKNRNFALVMKRKYDGQTLGCAVADAIRRHRLLDRGDRVVVALSGGADSVALLSVLVDQGYDCVAAHCNFHLRGEESQRDMRHARDVCRRLGVDLAVKDFDVAARCAATGESVEMACRSLRYEWFDELLTREHARALAVGHHREDNVETIMLNQLRGTGIDGMLGIRYRRDYVIRPMLDCTREQIESYLAARGLTYVTDSSNLSDAHLRNCLRNHVIPELERYFPDAWKGILATAANLRAAASIYHKVIEDYRRHYVGADGRIDLSGLVAEAGEDAPAVLRELLRDAGITAAQCGDMVASCGRSGLRFEAADCTTVVELDRGVLSVCRSGPPGRDDVYAVSLSRDILSPVNLRISRHDISEFRPVRDPDTIYLDISALDDSRPWTLRRWRRGDRISPYGMKGSRLVSDLFSDAKYSAADKRAAWLLTCGDEVVWVVGLRASRLFAVTPLTRTYLKIKYIHKQ